MGELEEKLNSILSSPREMEKILALARSLSGQGGGEVAGPAPVMPGPLGAAAENAGNLDPQLFARVSRLLGEYSAAGNEKMALVNTMRPWLRDGSYEKLRRAAEIARFAHAARAAFGRGGGA